LRRARSATRGAQQHEGGEDGFCWSRAVTVEEAELAISNGSQDRALKLWGLFEFEEPGIRLDDAREVAAAVTALLEEVEGQ
jgi:hypothetical protein